MTFQQFKADLMRRIKENKKTRWIRFGIVSLIFFLWVIWLDNPWVALCWILLFDIYITGYIPFTWWKKSKSKTVRTIMGWVDAIVYALVLVYFIFAFIGQNYMIPTSSLEKTLLTGDYLWVNKMVYGPRVPMTPVHFPLVHNTLPGINTRSYTEWPQFKYHRLPGLRSVERGDIVVFNFPAGDTIVTEVKIPFEQENDYYALVRKYGREAVHNDRSRFGRVLYRPVDRRENYVKRTIGLPGENIRIADDTIYIDSKPLPFPEKVQYNYVIALSAPITEDFARAHDIAPSDISMVSEPSQALQLAQVLGVTTPAYFYMMPLTAEMIADMRAAGSYINSVKMNSIWNIGRGSMYGGDTAADWTVNNWGDSIGVTIPKRGMTIKLDERAWDLYNRCIRNYENHPEAYFADGVAYIDGKQADTYTFDMDYYFMMGDNRDNSLDSRFWGFVPEDHVVGTPMVVLVSFDKERPLTKGGFRWERIFKDANPDK